MPNSWGRAPDQTILSPLAPAALRERLAALASQPWERAFHRRRHATVTTTPAGDSYALVITVPGGRSAAFYHGSISVAAHAGGSQLTLQVWRPAMGCGGGIVTALILAAFIAACAAITDGRLPLLTIICGFAAVAISGRFTRDREPTAVAEALLASLRGYLADPNGGYL